MVRQKNRIILDWFTISYRTVVLLVGTLVLLSVSGGLYWFYFVPATQRTEAAESMEKASSKLDEASQYKNDERVREAWASARAILGEARSAFDESRFDDARVAAIRSENLSQKVLDVAGGSERASSGVRLGKVEGDVRVKRAGEFEWKSADRKMSLGLGDQVKTSASGSIQLIYFDGTTTTITPGSLLEIRDVSEDPATKVRKVSEKLNWGEATASIQKRNVNGSFHEVATEHTAARSEDAGEFRVAFDKDKRTASVDVFTGRVDVSSSGRRESVAAGERIRAAADGKLLAKEFLPGVPRLVSPSDERVFVFEDPEKTTMTLSWEQIPGAARYRLVIADKFLFTDPRYDAERTETSVEIDGMANGGYYWKVAAISPSGVDGPFSAARHFRVTSHKIRDGDDKTPPLLEITEQVLTGPMLILNGRTEPGAILWVENEKVDVYEDGTFYAVIRLRKEGVNDILLVAQDTAGNEVKMTRRTYVESY